VPNSKSDGLYVLISGRVQGVGFRYGLRAEALRRGVTGWTKNRQDGRVEAFLEGDRVVLEEMLEWCRQGPRLASVRDVFFEWKAVDVRSPFFSILG
jgi:acylphosphatase